MSKAPEMQFVFTLELNAKTKEAIIQSLQGIIIDLYSDERTNIPCVISGGNNARYNYQLKHNAALTDEEYKAQLSEYLNQLKDE